MGALAAKHRGLGAGGQALAPLTLPSLNIDALCVVHAVQVRRNLWLKMKWSLQSRCAWRGGGGLADPGLLLYHHPVPRRVEQ